jgi:CMP-N,N'-diacetyllegionaminic acid synthase
MINNKKILCIVPARKNSKGLKDKNIKKINNKELFMWPLLAAKKSKYIDTLIISTDSEKIIDLAKKRNFYVPFKRPSKLALDTSKSSDVILHALNFFKRKKMFFDYIVMLEPTSPLTTEKEIDQAIRLIHKKNGNSLVSICESEKYSPIFHFKLDNNLLLKNYLNKEPTRRQDIPKTYYMDGSVYVAKVQNFMKNKTFVGKNTLGMILPKIKSFEIDDLIDYQIVKFLKTNENKFSKK